MSTKASTMRVTPVFIVLSVLFAVCLIVSNLLEIKVVDLGWFTITAGCVVFPVSYVINDCIVEVYGLRNAKFVIFLGFAMNLFTVLVLQVGILMPANVTPEISAAMDTVFGATPRILCASFTAFLVGSLINARVMHVMKLSRGASNSRRSFSFRAIASTIAGEGSDSLIFFPLAFGGTMSTEIILSMIVTQTCIKTVYEIVVLPITLRIVGYLRKHEAPLLTPAPNR